MGYNHVLSWWEVLLGFHGRTGRLRYLGLSLAVSLVAVWASLFVMTQIGHRAISARPFGVAAVFVPFVPVLWPLAALLAKRLQDMGRSGAHAAWLMGLWYLPSFEPLADHLDPALAMALGVVGLVAFLCVLFAPGTEGPNAYGLRPGMRVIRPSAA